MIKGCIGFSYISGRLCGQMMLVRGKRVIHVPLPIGIYSVMLRLWKRKNILGKILFKKSTDWQDIRKAKI
tara:strand:+ start:211 stop:420 length:210 start_codon:yes stop_codon:yes gene_type:complete